MANINISRFDKNNQKKNVSLATARINPAVLDETYGLATAGTLASGDVITLFNLPAKCVITNCYVAVHKAPTGTGQQATIQVKADAVSIMDAVAVGAQAAVVGNLKAKTSIDAGAEITATIGAQALSDGLVEVVVEFHELERTNGDYLN